MKKRQFILVDDERSNLIHNIMKDCYSDDRIIVHQNPVELNSSVLKFIRKIHLSSKINNVVELPFKHIWGNRFNEIIWKPDTEYYIIGVSGTLYTISPSYMNDLKKRFNIHYIMVLIDHFSSSYNKVARYYMERIEFDYIFSFDYEDIKRYNYTYFNIPYSMVVENSDEEIMYDLCFFCTNKGRLNKLLRIYSDSQNHSVNSFFVINQVPSKQQKMRDSITYNKFFTYPDVVECVKKSNCILDFPIEGQSGLGARYYESICYNKKLLTTNKNVVNLPFYNPDYIHVFEKPEDIDWDWVKERVPIDYQYDGRFSPIHLIDQIIELEEEKERQQNAKKDTP